MQFFASGFHNKLSQWHLDKVQGAQRGAEFLCQLSDGDAAIPIGILTNVSNLFQTLHAGWPAFEKSPQAWTYTGPLPLSCRCRYLLHPTSREGSPIGPGFWKHCLKTFLQSSANETLRDGVAEFSDSCFQRGERTYTCPREPHLAPSLPACANSLSHVYEHRCLRESLEDALDELGLGAHTGYQSLALETVCSCVSWRTAHSVVATAAASGSPRTLLTDAPRTVRPVKVASSCIAVPGKHFSSFRPRGTENSSDQYSSLSPQRKRVKMSQMGGTENAKENPNDSVLTVCASGVGKQGQEIVAGTQAFADPEEGTSKHNPGPLLIPTRAHLDGVRLHWSGLQAEEPPEESLCEPIQSLSSRARSCRGHVRRALRLGLEAHGAEAAVSLQRHSEIPRRQAHLRVPSAVPGCIWQIPVLQCPAVSQSPRFPGATPRRTRVWRHIGRRGGTAERCCVARKGPTGGDRNGLLIKRNLWWAEPGFPGYVAPEGESLPRDWSMVRSCGGFPGQRGQAGPVTRSQQTLLNPVWSDSWKKKSRQHSGSTAQCPYQARWLSGPSGWLQIPAASLAGGGRSRGWSGRLLTGSGVCLPRLPALCSEKEARRPGKRTLGNGTIPQSCR